YFFDYGGIATRFATLALPRRRWEYATDPGLPSVGFIESAVFDPEHWRPFIPNPAFDERTGRDILWGARIVAHFTDEQIRAAVECGKYSDPRATEYLVRILAERRDRIARQWLASDAILAGGSGGEIVAPRAEAPLESMSAGDGGADPAP